MVEDYWWITHEEIENPKRSGLVSKACVREHDFSSVRGKVWDWYAQEIVREDLSSGAKVVLWCLCRRWQYKSWSASDTLTFYAKACGLHRVSVGRAMSELLEKQIVWCVLEGERRRLKKPTVSGRKHYLLSGLGSLLRG
jgi:hypothetical protein